LLTFWKHFQPCEFKQKLFLSAYIEVNGGLALIAGAFNAE
jgi:hypothetical protein